MTVFWKISHFLYRFKVTKIFARIFEFLNYLICSNAVSARAEIGTGTKFWHRGVGCTIHYKAKIGNDCKILPNVIIGANSVVTIDVPDNCYAIGIPANVK